MTDGTTLDHVKAVADAVLYEGYVLYPYRASATKNQARWQFGVLVPPSYAATGTGEHSSCRTECLAEVGPDAELHIRLRFLQAQRRTVEAEQPDAPGRYREVNALIVGEDELLPWDEAIEREHDVVLPVRRLLESEQWVPVLVRGGELTTVVEGGRVVRRKQPLTAELRCRAERLPGLVRLHVTVANTASVDCSGYTRDEAVRHSLIAAHSVLTLTGGRFLSLLDPPEWAAEHARACVNEHTWPVLVGPPGSADTMLSSPIILYDHPKVAPESPGDLFDATEIDQLLTHSILALTDEEWQEIREGDPKGAEILERCVSLPPERLMRLYGATREFRPLGEATEAGR